MKMALNHFFFAAIFLLFSLVLIVSATGDVYTPKPDLIEKSNVGKESLLSTIIGIQGLIYCKSGPKLMPLEGGVARITCLAVDELGFEAAPFTFLSDASDSKGYFFATLCSSEIQDKRKLTECNAFLELSPLETCNVPTDVNKGISGALFSSYRLLNDKKKMKLYTVGPFFFTPESKSISNGKLYHDRCVCHRKIEAATGKSSVVALILRQLTDASVMLAAPLTVSPYVY